MAANLNVTRANVLNLSNVDLKNFLASLGKKVPVSKATRDEAERVALAFFDEVTSAEGATAGRGAALETEYEGVFAFPKAEGRAVTVVEGWSSVETSTEEEVEAASADEESDEEIAARIEAEAAAESSESDEAKAERSARAKARASNSDGVALSWRNPEVRAARLTKEGVSVVTSEGVKATFSSTRKAFEEFRLPIEKHIKFRLGLKASRVATIEFKGVVYTFSI